MRQPFGRDRKFSLVTKMTAYGLLLIIGLSVQCKTAGSSASAPQVTPQLPKNIVLMIGDGMGLSQLSAAMYSNRNQLALEKFPVIGLQKTASNSDLITDSAASATAISTGVKTYNGAIGMNKDTLPQSTIMEEAIKRGLSTGIVVTSTITHATPSSFYAHQPLRVMHERIAEDFVKTPVNFVVAGGKKYFERRDDEKNLIKELLLRNYQVASFLDIPLSEVPVSVRRNFFYFTADREPLPVTQGRDYLPYACRLGTNYLSRHSQGEGFFMLVEGSQIDWAGHANEGELVINEILDFERAVSKILTFAKRNKETLVIVTADHETGGLALQPGSEMGEIKTAFTSNGHTATMVPIFAYGPGAELFRGVYENTEIYNKMRTAFGWE
ncbi:MAG: alkaline phosphatase [Saprospiraceae bacterium]